MKTVVVRRAEHLLQGKSAIMTGATRSDKARVGEEWHGWDTFMHGLQVEEVNHFGRHFTCTGDTLQIRDENTQQIVCQVQVVEIKCVQTGLFNTEELSALGFDSRGAYEVTHGTADRRAWFIRVMPVSAYGGGELPAQ